MIAEEFNAVNQFADQGAVRKEHRSPWKVKRTKLVADEWKESFLKSLKAKHRIGVLWKSKKYVVWGMPFYNESIKKAEFESEFKQLLT